MTSQVSVIAALMIALPTISAQAEITWETSPAKLTLSPQAKWVSLKVKSTGADYLADAGLPLATIRVDGRTHNASVAVTEEDQLLLGFRDCTTRLVYEVEAEDAWISFRLKEIQGPRPSDVTLLQIPVSITANAGSRLNAAWDADVAVCLRGMNLQSQGTCVRGKSRTDLRVVTQDGPGPKLEGSGAVLIVARTKDLKPILQQAAERFRLPTNAVEGVASRDLPMARGSYWFLRFSEAEVDQVIDCCQRTGFRQVMMDSSSWCTSVGHFTFNTANYPDGVASLRRTVDRLHEHGILVGMHTFASKVSKHDAFVTPVPDRGFCVDRTATLAGAVSAEATEIRTSSDLSQWPGSPVCQRKVWEGHVTKHQEVIIDDEIVRYESIGPEGRWDTFLGCQRGAWDTQAASHSSGTECRHYAVDGCINGYILDQESPLFQQTTDRLAEVFNACGFDMVYFDGSEDVDPRRYHYYSSNAHAVAMSKFTRRPLIHMGGGFTHGLWHSFTRSGTIDQYPGTYRAYLRAGGTIDQWPTCKDHIDRTVKGVVACEAEMTPAELGWFGINPKDDEYDGLQFDEIEYLMCKSLAYDAPISLQTSFARLAAHPLTPDILEIIRRYEEIRAAGIVSSETSKTLKTPQVDFLLPPAGLQSDSTVPEFARVERIESVGGSDDVRVFAGTWGDGSLAALWHYAGKEGTIGLKPSDGIQVFDVQGKSIMPATEHGKTVLPLDQRRLVVFFPSRSVAQVKELFQQATVDLRQPAVIWLSALDFRSRVGKMVTAAEAKLNDPGAIRGFICCDGPFDRSGQTACYAEYQVDLPHPGRWTLWARVRYPTGGDMSFGLVPPDQQVTLTGDQVIGNCGVNDGGWHWTGRGGGVTTVPPGQPAVFVRQAGKFVFRIYPREGPGTLAGNPRLDLICLSEDPDYRPTDADAHAAMARQ